jgi:hypothetical protein
LGEGGLSSAQGADERYHVAHTHRLPEAYTQTPHVLGVVRHDDLRRRRAAILFRVCVGHQRFLIN